MIETREKYKDYEIIINEFDNIKELIIIEELKYNYYNEVFEIKSSNEEITKKAKKIIENSK